MIDQRLAPLRTLIPQCREQSAGAEKRFADKIITLEIKRIEAIHALKKRLGELRALIPIYKARSPTYEQVLAKQIIDFDLQLIAAKTKQFPTHPTTPNLLEPYPRAPPLPTAQPPIPQQIRSNDMNGVFAERPRHIPNLYWQQGQPIGAQVSNFRQIKYLPLPNAVPDLDQAFAGARVDCGRDLHKQLIEFGGAAKL